MRESMMRTVSNSSLRSVESQLEWMCRPSIVGVIRSAEAARSSSETPSLVCRVQGSYRWSSRNERPGFTRRPIEELPEKTGPHFSNWVSELKVT